MREKTRVVRGKLQNPSAILSKHDSIQFSRRDEGYLMPNIGEIRKGREIGKKPNHQKFIWQGCLDCGKERWVQFGKGKAVCARCNSCAAKLKIGEKGPNWKDGRNKSGAGYIVIMLQPDDFFYPMAMKSGFILEHRLVMAKHLNRCLLSWEVVHHKGTKYPIESIENKQDNRIENLELLSCQGKHNVQINKRIKELEKRVTLLEAENILLKEQLNKQQVNI